MGLRWPVPEGWGAERIEFPLPFAPSLPYLGIEELRFMPGWAKPSAPDHWSYLFAWWLDAATPPDLPTLEAQLTAYYIGLCAGVGGQSAVYDPSGFRVELRVDTGASRAGHGVARSRGMAALFDAFAAGNPLTLNLRLETWACPIAGSVVVLIEACPTLDRVTWEQLHAHAGELVCH
jgi:hypothetical protein